MKRRKDSPRFGTYGDDLTLLESRPDEFNKLLVGSRVTEFLLHAEDESTKNDIKSALIAE